MKGATNGNKRPKIDVLRIEQDIRALMREDKSSNEIMSTLKIPERTFRDYTARIYKQDRETWLNITKEELSTELLKLRSSLSDTYRYCLSKLNDKDIPSSELLDWLEAKDTARLNLVKILTDYPRQITSEMVEPEPEPEEIEPPKESKEMRQSRLNIQKMLKKK